MGLVPGAPKPHRARPDPRPSRLAMGAGALAALSVMGAGLVRIPYAEADASPPGPPLAVTSSIRAERPVRYVRLKRGQDAPPGATVIREADPTPRVIRRVVREAPRRASRTAARTRQSGR